LLLKTTFGIGALPATFLKSAEVKSLETVLFFHKGRSNSFLEWFRPGSTAQVKAKQNDIRGSGQQQVSRQPVNPGYLLALNSEHNLKKISQDFTTPNHWNPELKPPH